MNILHCPHQQVFSKSILFVSLLFLAGCNVSITADVTPPPGYQMEENIAYENATPSQPLFPVVPPDPTNGRKIYLEQCADCHGVKGLGDGERALDLPNPPAAIGSFQLGNQAIPADWFEIVSQGNMGRNMPAFPNLTDRQRWDVISFVLSLNGSESDIGLGEETYSKRCSGCHGSEGKGDGPLAENLQAQDLTKQDFQAHTSNLDLFNTIRDGSGSDMPAFGTQLSEGKIWELASYIRHMGTINFVSKVNNSDSENPFQLQSDPKPASTENVVQNLVSVSGQVTNGSGSELPEGLVVTLYTFNQMQIVTTSTQEVGVNGTYIFENVPLSPGQDIIASIEHQGAIYSSNMVSSEVQDDTLSLPIEIFDTSQDTSGLIVDRLHYFFELVDEGTIRIVELYVISNPSLKTIVAAKVGRPVLKFHLPSGAENLEIQDGGLGGRYVKTDDGVGDTFPIYPGEAQYQMLFSYTLPFERKFELSNQLEFDINALVILVPQNTISVTGDKLEESGLREVQGLSYQMYTGGGYQKDEKLRISIAAQRTGLFSGLSKSSIQEIGVGLASLGIVLLAIGSWALKRSSKGQISDIRLDFGSHTETVDSLLDAILALDDLYQAKKLPENTYIERRSELKTRLKKLREE